MDVSTPVAVIEATCQGSHCPNKLLIPFLANKRLLLDDSIIDFSTGNKFKKLKTIYIEYNSLRINTNI